MIEMMEIELVDSAGPGQILRPPCERAEHLRDASAEGGLAKGPPSL
jgi:hypothetical protein